MGTWGIAKDMAKLNEENLSKLSRKGMFQKLKDYGSGSAKRVYTFKKATPQIIESIRKAKELENLQIRKRGLILGGVCLTLALILLWVTLTF